MSFLRYHREYHYDYRDPREIFEHPFLIKCSSCDFDIANEIWPMITSPCTTTCNICPTTERISVRPVDTRGRFYTLFKDTCPNRCTSCSRAVMYVYYGENRIIRGLSLPDIHVKVLKSRINFCCLMKPPFHLKNRARCATCTSKVRATPDQRAA
jgi:hypothetical protein